MGRDNDFFSVSLRWYDPDQVKGSELAPSQSNISTPLTRLIFNNNTLIVNFLKKLQGKLTFFSFLIIYTTEINPYLFTYKDGEI